MTFPLKKVMTNIKQYGRDTMLGYYLFLENKINIYILW